MDFKKVLAFLARDFEVNGVSYALIGGIALGALGIIRATVDLDFLVKKDDLKKVREIMESHGYKTVYESENVSQYLSELKPFGSVDFLHAFRPVSLSMLGRAGRIKVFDGEIEIPVLQPEDIVGLKVQALANNSERREWELADIKRVFEKYGQELDWDRLRYYFELFDLGDLYYEYRKRIK